MNFEHNIIQIKNTFTEEQIINATPEKIIPQTHTLEFSMPFVAVFIINERIEKTHTLVKEMFDMEHFSDENNEIVKRFKIIYADFNTIHLYMINLSCKILNLMLTMNMVNNECENQSSAGHGSSPGPAEYHKMFKLRNLHLGVLNRITKLEEEMREFCQNPDSSF